MKSQLVFLALVVTIHVGCAVREFPSKAMALCAGSRFLDDALSVIEQCRNVWKSSIPAYIIHCDEVTDDVIMSTRSKYDVDFFNICNGASRFNMSYESTTKLLRSWFCKVATMILLPVDEVLLVDVDVVLFKSPEIVFESPGYINTGTLFFRDRHLYSHNHLIDGRDSLIDLLKVQAPHINMNSTEFITSKLLTHHRPKGGIDINRTEHGHLLYLLSVFDPSKSFLHYQDSSMVAVNRKRHPKFIQVLQQLLPNFRTGWGDKEIYWIAAFIADEPFAFSPYLMGGYGGNCDLYENIMMHFDPRFVSKAEPFYLNARDMLENVNQPIGVTLKDVMLAPALATYDLIPYRIEKRCSRRFINRFKALIAPVPVPGGVNQLIARALWQRRSRLLLQRLHQSNFLASDFKTHGERVNYYESLCINIHQGSECVISTMIDKHISRLGLCRQLGCAHIPIPAIDQAAHDPYKCLPISFAFDTVVSSVNHATNKLSGSHSISNSNRNKKISRMNDNEEAFEKMTLENVTKYLFSQNRYTTSRAMVLYASETSDLDNEVAIIEQIRNVWKSSLFVYIGYCCNYMDPEAVNSAIDKLRFYGNASLFNICHASVAVSVEWTNLRKSELGRAVTVASIPVDEILLVASDVIFLHSPEVVFQSEGYVNTGILMFRDFFTVPRGAADYEKAAMKQKAIETFLHSEMPHIKNLLQLSTHSGRLYRYEKTKMHDWTSLSPSSPYIGTNYASFFANILNRTMPPIVSHIDSSVVVVNKKRHPKLTDKLNKLLSNVLNWGVSDVYWVAALISEEPFAFSPYLPAYYGRQMNALLQYVPVDTIRAVNFEASYIFEHPYYIKALRLFDKQNNWIGKGIESMVSQTTLATLDTVTSLHTAEGQHNQAPTQKMKIMYNRIILRAVWERLVRYAKQTTSNSPRTDSTYTNTDKNVCVRASTNKHVKINSSHGC